MKTFIILIAAWMAISSLSKTILLARREMPKYTPATLAIEMVADISVLIAAIVVLL